MKSKLFIIIIMALFVITTGVYAESSTGIDLWTGETSFDLNYTQGNEVELFFNVTNVTNDTTCNVEINPSDYESISKSEFDFSEGNHSENLSLINIKEGTYNYQLYCTNNTDDFSEDISFEVNITNAPVLTYNVSVDGEEFGKINDLDFDENSTLIIELSSINNPLVERVDSFSYESDDLEQGLLSDNIFNFSTNFESSGNYTINFSVEQEDGIDYQILNFEVNDVNRPPFIEFLDGSINKSIIVMPGDTVDEIFRYGDPDGDDVDVSCSDSDRTSIINETHGVFNYDIGTYDSSRNITCSVTDDEYEKTIRLEVNVEFNRFNIDIDGDDGLLFEQGSNLRDSRISKEVTISNNLDDDIKVDITSDIDEDYSFRFRYGGTNYDSLNDFPIDAKSENSFEVSIIIPNDVSLSRRNIGEILFSEEEDDFEFDVYVRPSSMLRFDRLDYDVIGEDSGRLRSGDTIDVSPNDEVEISVELLNAFSEDSDIWIEDVELFYTIENIDDGDDITGSIYFNDIEADEIEVEYFTFYIPTRLASGTYDVILEVEGEDENRFMHEEIFEFELDVSKSRSELIVEEFSFDRDNVGCLRYANLDLSLVNIGRDDLEEWRYRINSGSVDFSKSEEFDLDSYRRRRDNDYISFSEEVDFSGVSVGEHDFELRVYDDRNRLEFVTTASIYVDVCDDIGDDNDDDDDEIDIIIDDPGIDDPDDPDDSNDQPDYIVDTGAGDYRIIFLLGILNVVLVALLILILVKVKG